MVYKWEEHKEVCRRLYVDEKLSFRAISVYMKEHHNFGARYVAPLRPIIRCPLHPPQSRCCAHRTQLPTYSHI